MTPKPTPTTSRRELARTLRDLRQRCGCSLEQVHAETGLDAGFLSRVERGLRGLGDDNADALTAMYGASPEVTARVRQLASSSRRQSWWDRSGLPGPIKDYIGFEQAATAISVYGSIVPGLLQTRSYAEAAVAATEGNRDGEVRAAIVEQRMRRQEVLDGPNPPWVNIILDESALRREVGGRAVLQLQARALLAAARGSRTTIRLISFEAGAHPGMDSRFVMISTLESFDVDFVHVEGLSGYRNYQRAADVDRFTRAWGALTAVAMSADETLIALARVAASESST